jgi:hypothetical protein
MASYFAQSTRYTWPGEVKFSISIFSAFDGMDPAFHKVDFGRLETHFYPSKNETKSKKSGLSLHRCLVQRKLFPINRNPVSFGKIQEHCCVAAGCHDSAGRRIRLQPVFCEKGVSFNAPHAVFSKKNEWRAPRDIQNFRRARQCFEPPPRLLAAGAMADSGDDRFPQSFEFDLAAFASGNIPFSV